MTVNASGWPQSEKPQWAWTAINIKFFTGSCFHLHLIGSNLRVKLIRPLQHISERCLAFWYFTIREPCNGKSFHAHGSSAAENANNFPCMRRHWLEWGRRSGGLRCNQPVGYWKRDWKATSVIRTRRESIYKHKLRRAACMGIYVMSSIPTAVQPQNAASTRLPSAVTMYCWRWWWWYAVIIK